MGCQAVCQVASSFSIVDSHFWSCPGCHEPLLSLLLWNSKFFIILQPNLTKRDILKRLALGEPFLDVD
jgi:hypothetical protein